MRKILPLLCFLLFTAPAFADIPAELLKKAEGGDAQAQLDVATMYMSGDNVTADETKALEWLRKSADGGNREAVFSLAMLYHNGQIVAKDEAQAAAWFQKAADAGDVVSQYELGNLYHAGAGVDQNDIEAVKYWRMAADRGHLRAPYLLGQAYMDGKGVEQDYAEAYFWLTFGVNGDMFPGEAQTLRDQAAQKLSPEKMAALEKRASDWLSLDAATDKEKAEKGDLAAMDQLGARYQFGSGVIKNEKTMMQWYMKAANSGYAPSQYALGMFYNSAPGKWNAVEAYKWFMKAAKKGHAPSQKQVGDLTRDGVGTKTNAYDAAKWYRKAALQADAFAESELGALYFAGKGVERDNADAVFWLSLAAAHGKDIYKDQREAAQDLLTPEQKEGVKKRLLAWQAKNAGKKP